MARLIHGNELGQGEVRRRIADDDHRVRGKGLVVHIDGLDVLEARDGPVGPEGAVGGEVDRVFGAEPSEKRYPALVFKERAVGDVDGLEGAPLRV